MTASSDDLGLFPQNQPEGGGMIHQRKSVQKCQTFEELGRSPLVVLQQKNLCSLPRISKRQDLLPGLLNQPVAISKAARQWGISESTNIHNSLELNKLCAAGEAPAPKFVEPLPPPKTRELRAMKLSFRKRVIEPLEPLQPRSSFAPPLSSKRHERQSENEPQSAGLPLRNPLIRQSSLGMQLEKPSLPKLSTLSLHQPTENPNRLSLS